jgi:hypothetical protein
MSQAAEGGVKGAYCAFSRERKTCSRERKTDLRSQVLEPGQSAPVRLSNMIALPAGLRGAEISRYARPSPEKCDRIAGASG